VVDADRRIARRVGAWNRPIAVGLASLVLAATFATLRLQSYHWNPTGFVHAGGVFVDPRTAPRGLLIRQHEVGFDGTGFYRLALDPFTRSKDAYGIDLDLPAFRQQRIGYPLIVWALSAGGRPGAVGWMLVLVNVAALGAIGWITGAIAASMGRHALWGLLVPLYPGFAVSLGLDTAEIVAAAFALGAVLMLLHRKHFASTCLLVAAMLTRETTLLLALGIGVAGVVARRRGTPADRVPLAVAFVPVTAYVAWQMVLRSWWGQFPVGQGAAIDLAAPFWGLGVAARGWPQGGGLQTAYHIVLVLSMIAFAATALAHLTRSEAPFFAKAGLVIGIVMTVAYSEAIWLHHWGFLRAFTETYLAGAVVVLASRIDLLRLTVGAATLWVSIAVNLVLHP
jgi:hypothetical protein